MPGPESNLSLSPAELCHPAETIVTTTSSQLAQGSAFSVCPGPGMDY